MVSLAEFYDEDGFRLRRFLGSGRTAMILICIAVYSALDAHFTILLTSRGAVELNPIMAFYLNIGPIVFISVKFLLTFCSLFVLFTFRKVVLKKLKISPSSILPVISFGFIAVLAWELFLFYQLLCF